MLGLPLMVLSNFIFSASSFVTKSPSVRFRSYLNFIAEWKYDLTKFTYPARCHATVRIRRGGFTDEDDELFNQVIDRLDSKDSKVDKYWIPLLRGLTQKISRRVALDLVPEDLFGYSASASRKEGTFYEFMLKEKEKRRQCVILARVGDFYETYGVDSIMLMEYANLNPMAGNARAGCPVPNVQMTLDSLTEAGLSVAVYEEKAWDSVSKGKGKTRYLSQVRKCMISTPCLLLPLPALSFHGLCIHPIPTVVYLFIFAIFDSSRPPLLRYRSYLQPYGLTHIGPPPL